jgi:serine/threonine-protein kinase
LEPDSVGAARFWLRMLVAHGAPVETLRAAIRRTAELERTRQSPTTELMTESLVDYLSGNFAPMVHRFPKWEAQWTSEQYELDAEGLAETELVVLEEIGDRKNALRVAQLLVQRIRGMLPPMAASARAGVLAVANREGKRSGLDATALQGQWLEELRRSSTRAFRNEGWIELVARPARSAEDARAALALLPEWSPLPPVTLDVWDAESRGRLYLLVGEAEKAVPLLQHSATRCHLSEDWELADQLRASEELGDALEATGDTAGACAAWGDVISHWGHAKPRSLTAEKAKAGMKRVGCAKPAVTYTQPAALKGPQIADAH